MDVLHINPILGHITTFGGNPLISAAALATLKIILNTKIMKNVVSNEKYIRSKLVHKKIKEIRVEEVRDFEEGSHFYRVYFYHDDGRINIMSESSTKPILARYVSEVY